MALQKNIQFKEINLSYWAISSLAWNKVTNKTVVSIVGYVNKDARIKDVNNFIAESQRVYSYEGRLTLVDAYSRLKFENCFKNATDV
jgi:hypothetical protein